MPLIFIGTIIVVIGIFLPWLSGYVSGPMLSSGVQTVTGYELNQGLIGAGIALLSGVLGLLGSGKVMPRRFVGFMIVIASIVIVMVSGSLIIEPGGGIVSAGPLNIRTSVSPEPGVFVTVIGGIVLFIGSLIVAFKSKEDHMAKWKTGNGVVVALRYVGPAAPAPEWHWTALIVDLETGERISALLEPKVAKKNLIVVGDRIRLDYQPGQDAGMSGFFGRKRGLCRNVELLRQVTA